MRILLEIHENRLFRTKIIVANFNNTKFMKNKYFCLIFLKNRIRIVCSKRFLQAILLFPEHMQVAQLYMQLVWNWYSN